MLNAFGKNHLVGTLGLVTLPFTLLFGVARMLIRVQLMTVQVASQGRLFSPRRG